MFYSLLQKPRHFVQYDAQKHGNFMIYHRKGG